MPRKPTYEDGRRLIGLLEQDRAYDRLILASPNGHESLQLRERGRVLTEAGRLDEAFEHFAQAVALHPEDDDSAAANAARHDMAHGFIDRTTGVPIENLLAAERLLRRALRSPERNSQPRRRAITLNLLGICLRRMAAQSYDEVSADKILEEAIGAYREAANLSEGLGVLGWADAAEHWANLGNLLRDQVEDLDRAVGAYEQALGLRKKFKDHPEYQATQGYALIALNAATAYARRAKRGELKRAESLAWEVVNRGSSMHRDHARLVLAEVLCARGADVDRRVARAELGKLKIENLHPDQVRRAVDLWRQLGDLPFAIAALYGQIQLSFGHRSSAVADHEADHASLLAQAAAGEAARIHVEQGDHVEAFLALENTSGLRFAEALSAFTWRPEDGETKHLVARWEHLRSLSIFLATMASLVVRMKASDANTLLGEAASDLEAHPERAPTTSAVEMATDLVARIRSAVADRDPATHLRKQVTELMPQVTRVSRLLEERQPPGARAVAPLVPELDREALTALARAHGDHVFLRLHLRDDLLVVAAWFDGEAVQAQAAVLALPRDLFRQLRHAEEESSAADYASLSTALGAVDLSSVLPALNHRRVVVLPSLLASRLPLAVVGPPGRRLIDLFDAIVWLPSLFPLVTRQAAHPPRKGTLSVAPGEHGSKGATLYHELGLQHPLRAESQLTGRDATLMELLSRVPTADVVSFYAHGKHGGPAGSSVHLAGGSLSGGSLGQEWPGLERVELWACESGVSLPVDPLVPPSEEAFGLDFDFLKVGVRSAIGTLWKVVAIVTAAIVDRYRRLLSDGSDAPRALAEAQRWWVGQGAPALIAELRTKPLRDAARNFTRSLGLEIAVDDVLGGLAPADAAGLLTAGQIKSVSECFLSPITWGGFRFVGVSERRPLQVWSDACTSPPTDDERRSAELLLVEPPDAPPVEPQDDQLERELSERSVLSGNEALTAPLALEMARRYRDRVASSYEANLFIALSWLHEALALPNVSGLERARVLVRAAHLWLDLAAGEIDPPGLLCVYLPDRAALARADRMLAEPVPAEFERDAAAARARLGFLRAISKGSIDDAVRTAWSVIEPYFNGASGSDEEDLRFVSVACDIVRSSHGAVEGAAGRCLDAVDDLFERRARDVPVELISTFARAAASRLALADACDAETAGPRVPEAFLTPRERLAVVKVRLKAIGEGGALNAPVWRQYVSDALGAFEGASWGYPSDDRRPLLAASFSPGWAYRFLGGYYLASKAVGPGQDAAHILACQQLAADLRTVAENRLVRTLGQTTHTRRLIDELSFPLRHRDHLLALLRDASLLRGLDADLARLDPFRLSCDEIVERAGEAGDEIAWMLTDRARVRPTPGARACRTAAFEATQTAAAWTTRCLDVWSSLLDTATNVAGAEDVGQEAMRRLLDPGLRLEANEEKLRGLSETQGMIGLAFEHTGRLILTALWRGKGGLEGRVLDGGAESSALIVELFRAHAEDFSELRGLADDRRQETWNRLSLLLGEQLGRLLNGALADPARDWLLFAPGPLRPLPLLGIEVDGKPLFHAMRSLVHLPALGFDDSRPVNPKQRPNLACLLAAPNSSFGAAAVLGLRRAFQPNVIVDPVRLQGTKVVEVDTLLRVAHEIEAIRFYGEGGVIIPTEAGASLRLSANRRFSAHNTHGLSLANCASVELWADTTGGFAALAIAKADRDAMPSLVGSFIAAGARGVLDLAWPVLDLVKALVVEQFEIERRRVANGPRSLAQALRVVHAMLDRWREQTRNASDVVEALGVLDRLRIARLARAGVDALPFAAACPPELVRATASVLVDEACQPVHLAAFRWWGG